ncbi:hypothetical protein AX16_010888 [Volvariella volvacea WC 439]|nr:hypothetical protein AX16_010888 [Volvariella volvacea WC 439]
MASSRSSIPQFGFIAMLTWVVFSLFVSSASSAAILPRDEPLKGALINAPPAPAPAAGTYQTDLPYRFTLAALNVTTDGSQACDNSTGVPLVLGQDGASAGITFHVTSTYATFPYNDYPNLSLTASTLRAYTPTNEWITNGSILTTANETTGVSRNYLYWYTSRLYSSPAEEIFSVLMPDPALPVNPYPLLAVYGDAENWSLCVGTGTRPQTNLYYAVEGEEGGCYRVKVNVVPFA